jgi:quinol monooxygenase YgiN
VSGIRVIVNIAMESASMVDAGMEKRVERCSRVEATEQGCLQYETFRSVHHPEKMVLLEHWASYELYDRHWTDQVAREGAPQARSGSKSVVEFYRHEPFTVVDGIWVPADSSKRSQTIRWS